MSAQQTLNLPIPNQHHYGNWVRHAQVEDACGRIALWLVRGGLLWLTSDEMAGKSHFMQALGAEHPQIAYLEGSHEGLSSVQQLKTWLNTCEHHAYWVVDLPAGNLSPALAFATFHLIERAKAMNKALLICWRSEASSALPPELHSRLQMMDSAQMTAPASDEALQQVLHSVLQSMQWDMKDAVLHMLLQHVPRSLADLLAAVTLLDCYSRQHRLKINATSALKILQSVKQDD